MTAPFRLQLEVEDMAPEPTIVHLVRCHTEILGVFATEQAAFDAIEHYCREDDKRDRLFFIDSRLVLAALPVIQTQAAG